MMMRLDDQQGLWLRRFHDCGSREHLVVCFPHAGASAGFYRGLSAALAAERVDVMCLQYPGRQDRRGEPGISSITSTAREVAGALRGLSDRPVVMFGHSMGAVLAFEAALQLQEAGLDNIRGLIASGRRAPSIHRYEDLHNRGDRELIAEMRRLSGTDSRLLADDEVLKMIMPAVRSDYKAIEEYRYEGGSALKCPISAFVGSADPRVSVAEVRAWQDHTEAAFRLRVFSGGHFYLNRQEREVASAITGEIATFG